MIDPRFKSFSLLILCYISHEDVAIVEEYDKISLYPMLLKCHNHLYHVLIYKVDCAYSMVEKYCNLDTFEQIANTNEPMKELVRKELQIFKIYQVNIKNIEWFFFNVRRSTNPFFTLLVFWPTKY
jgi:hypothetical protein